MLHVFSDSFDIQSGDIFDPISDFSAGADPTGLQLIRANALASSALTSDAPALKGLLHIGGGLLHNDMGIVAVDGSAFGTSSIIVDPADSFRFPQQTISNGLVHIPPVPFVSPTQDQEVTFIAGVEAGGAVAANSLAAWNSNTNPATYKTNTTEAKWGTNTAGTAGGTVTYFFDAGSAWTATEQAVFVAAYALWSDIANIQFAPAANATVANILIKRGPLNDGAHFDGKLTTFDANAGDVGQNVLWNFNTSGDGNPAHQSTLNIETGAVAGGFGPITADPNVAGGHVWGTVVHEEGHSLGLGHGGPYNGNVIASQQQFSAQDMELWTVMSYIGPTTATPKYAAEYPITGTNWGTSADLFPRSPTTPMMLDILAAQRLYGAATSGALTTGQTFGFNCTIADASKPFFDFTVNTNPVVTIWDSGANNTLDLSGFSTSSNVNLNAGTFSSCNGMVNNIGIAAGTTINTFVGGTGDDTVVGNNNGDLISAGLGAGRGNDNFTGGTGNDGFYLGASYTIADRVNGGPGTNDQVALEGTYTGVTIGGTQFQNVEVLALKPGSNYGLILQDDLTAAGTTFSVWSVSMASVNSVNIDASAESNATLRFFLGQGNDAIAGGQAGNLFYGEGGQDSLTGGSGVDTFSYLAVSDSTGPAADLIRGFTTAQDKFQLPAGIAVTGIDTFVNGGTLNSGNFNVDLAAAVGGAQLLAGHAVLFHATTTDYASDNLWLIVDANGVAGYQANADFVFNVTGSDYTALSTANFI